MDLYINNHNFNTERLKKTIWTEKGPRDLVDMTSAEKTTI